MTAADLARRLEVSERTVYRDISALSTAGGPVYAERGPGGGWMLVGGYRTNLTGLTGDEARTLFIAGNPRPPPGRRLGGRPAAPPAQGAGPPPPAPPAGGARG